MEEKTFGYYFNFVEGTAPSPAPGGDIFSALTQTGDWLWTLILALLGVAIIAICGIVVVNKVNLKSYSISDVLASRKAVVIIACAVIAISSVVAITISSRALAEENHYEPAEKEKFFPVNVYVDKETGAITSENFVFNTPVEEEEDYYAIKIFNPALRAGNGYENLNANVAITDQTQHFDIIDGYLNSFEMARVITVKRNDICSINVSGIDAETAKSLIGQNDVFYFTFNVGQTISQEDYKADVDLYVGPWSNNFNFDQVALERLKSEGWDQEGQYYIKSMKVHTSMSDALSIFYSLISDNHINEKNGYVFVGFCDEDGTLSRTVEQTDIMGPNTCFVQQVFIENSQIHEDLTYVLTLKDFDDVKFKLSPEGEALAKENGWEYDPAENTLTKQHVSCDLMPFDVVKLFNSDNVLCSTEKTYFNNWSVFKGFGIPSNLSTKLFCISGSISLFIDSWTEEELVKEVVPATEAVAEVATDAPTDEVTVSDEAAAGEAVAAEEAVAVEDAPVVEQIVDYVTEELPEAVAPIVLLLLWFI